MSHIRYTLIPIEEMIFALPADQWQLRLVPDGDHNDLSVLSPVYTSAQLLRAVGFLRGKNRSGYHIYRRSISYRHILVDDVDQDALDQLHDDGLRANVVVRTSKDNYQAWITISDDDVSPEIATAAAKILAKRYGGDSGSTDAQHVGRLPTAEDRFDIGLFISTDGDLNGDGARSGGCMVSSLDTAPISPFIDLDGDGCGDIDATYKDPRLPLVQPIGPITVSCVDNDGDGRVDISHCATWKEPGQNDTCTTPSDIGPGSPSQCSCETLTSICIAVDDGDPCTDNLCDPDTGRSGSKDS